MSEMNERDAVTDNGNLHPYWRSATREALMDALAFQGAITKELLKRNETLLRILAALREPSAAVVDAATEAFADYDDMRHGVRAAVAAAEREVDG